MLTLLQINTEINTEINLANFRGAQRYFSLVSYLVGNDILLFVALVSSKYEVFPTNLSPTNRLLNNNFGKMANVTSSGCVLCLQYVKQYRWLRKLV